MIHPVLKSSNLMVGVEIHPALFGIVPMPACPHLVGTALSEAIWGDEGKTNEDVLSEGAKTLARGHDIGSMIPHIAPPHLLLMVHIPLSGSKSLFGASSVLTPKGPLAVSLFPGGSVNLNCSTPVSLPLGFVDCSNTHLAGLTIGDVLAGVVVMVVDIGTSWLLSRIMKLKPIEQALGRLTDRICPAIFRSVVRVDRVTEWSLRSVSIGGVEMMEATVRQEVSVGIDRVLANPVERALVGEAVGGVAEEIVGANSGYDEAVERFEEEIYEIPAPEYPRRPPDSRYIH